VEGAAATIKDVTEEVTPMKREVIAESAAMREVLSFVRKVALSEATTILLEGENRTGKDLVAKTLHYESPRQAEPFIAINCAAIPETLLESELFGYEKGAFTDARAKKRGLFELADKGTLFTTGSSSGASKASRRRRWTCFWRTTGRETCASCATRSNGR